MALLDELTDDTLERLGFVREQGTLSGIGQVYWRKQSLRLNVQGNLLLLAGYNPVAVRGGHYLELWSMTFSAETPMPLVMAALRRASDYMDVTSPEDPV